MSFAPSYRRRYIGWIMHAAKEETRERRLREAVALLEQNKKLGLKQERTASAKIRAFRTMLLQRATITTSLSLIVGI
jgi:uncharacterized protein YdeI (YjbR/CyaY-like superfamily)